MGRLAQSAILVVVSIDSDSVRNANVQKRAPSRLALFFLLSFFSTRLRKPCFMQMLPLVSKSDVLRNF